MNFWSQIPAGDYPPCLVNAVIEVVSGSRDKYEYDREWEAFVLDRVLYSSVVFPVEYGFIPRTLAPDNDPLDIMVLTYAPVTVGCIVKVKPIAVLVMEDEEGEDSKILSVPLRDPRFEGFNDIKDVHYHKLKEIQEFFEVYKRLEPTKWVKFKTWMNAEEARAQIKSAMERYLLEGSAKTEDNRR